MDRNDAILSRIPPAEWTSRTNGVLTLATFAVDGKYQLTIQSLPSLRTWSPSHKSLLVTNRHRRD